MSPTSTVKLLLTLVLRHFPPQLRVANCSLWNDGQVTQKPRALVQSRVRFDFHFQMNWCCCAFA